MKPQPNGHLAAYRRAFGDDPRIAAGAIPARLIAVVFTNRCGSMLFTEMIGSSPDVITRYEVFNGDVVTRKTQEHGFKDFAAYLRYLFARERVTYTAKIHIRQLAFLAEMGLLNAFANGVELFLVRRRDTVAQAVSHSIARQTGKWTSFAPASDGEVRYDPKEIAGIHRGILADHRHFHDMAQAMGLTWREVVFEDFVNDPAAVLEPAWSRLDLRPGTLDPGRTRHRRQATGRNAEFARRFRADVSASGAGAACEGGLQSTGITDAGVDRTEGDLAHAPLRPA